MSLITELQGLQDLYTELRESIYSFADEAYAPNIEYMVSTPVINTSTYENFREGLININETLNSSLLSDILEILDEESNFSAYIKFDSQNFQMEFIQEQIDAYDENLAGYQEQAASLSSEKEQENWDEAQQDVQTLFEDLLPRIF